MAGAHLISHPIPRGKPLAEVGSAEGACASLVSHVQRALTVLLTTSEPRTRRDVPSVYLCRPSVCRRRQSRAIALVAILRLFRYFIFFLEPLYKIHLTFSYVLASSVFFVCLIVVPLICCGVASHTRFPKDRRQPVYARRNQNTNSSRLSRHIYMVTAARPEICERIPEGRWEEG